MAHSRNIKPGIYKNEDLAECSIWARYLFSMLPMVADREGRLEDRPKRIKGEIFPFDSVDVDPLLSELEGWGFIDRYQVHGVNYIQIVKFLQHQRPHATEKDSAIPDRDGLITVHTRGKNGCITGTYEKIKANNCDLTVNSTSDHALIHRFTDSLIHKTGSKRQQSANTVGPQAAQPENQNPKPKPPELKTGAVDAAPDTAPLAGTENPPSGGNSGGRQPEPNADAITARAVEIAVLLRQRGAGVAPGEIRLREWAGQGITDAALLTALETAVQRRVDAGSVQPVNSGLLDSILADVLVPSGGAPPARASPRGGGRQAARDAYLADAAAAAQKHSLDEIRGGDGRNERDITGQCARVA